MGEFLRDVTGVTAIIEDWPAILVIFILIVVIGVADELKYWHSCKKVVEQIGRALEEKQD